MVCQFQTPAGPVVKQDAAAVFYPPIVRTSTKTALVVGTVLTGINHGRALLHGHWPVTPLTYCVPYGVATYGAVMAARVSRRGSAIDPWLGSSPTTNEEAEAPSSLRSGDSSEPQRHGFWRLWHAV